MIEMAEKKEPSQSLKAIEPVEAAFKILIHLSMQYPSPIKRGDLLVALNIKLKTIEKAIEKLKQNGLVTSQKRGYYTSTLHFAEIFAYHMDILQKLKSERG